MVAGNSYVHDLDSDRVLKEAEAAARCLGMSCCQAFSAFSTSTVPCSMLNFLV
jgi:hypothetical protein